jgi:hypothetical protein
MTDESGLTVSSDPALSSDGPGARFVPAWAILALCLLVTLVASLDLYSLWAFWPTSVQGQNTTGTLASSQEIYYFSWRLTLPTELLFFLIVAIAGILGGLIHTARSLTWYIGNRDLRWSWLPFNLLIPIIGALAATVFYLVLRAGLFSPSTSAQQASPFGFAAVAVLVGLFSEQALEKLKQVSSNFFAERPTGADHVPPKEP